MMLLVFTLDDWRCALELSSVEKVYRAVAVTPLPDAPDIVLGVVNVRGAVLPVVDVRRRFRLPEKNLTPDDQFIVANSSGRLVVLVVDNVAGVIECSGEDIVPASAIVPGMEYVEGVARLKDGMILIHNLARFLSLEEKTALEQALENI
ncbi:chemotaxis protein CheW [Methylobacter sp.]|uniref:chemotaxis protein CheW n=2 Tax=Methylobacter sp. TaxID=2051955 RepID=UPI002FE2AB3B